MSNNVYGVVYDYTLLTSVYGVVYDFVADVLVGCVQAMAIYQPGAVAADVYQPGAVETQVGCC